MPKNRAFFIGSIIVCLPGCVKQNELPYKKKSQNIVNDDILRAQWQVPIPLEIETHQEKIKSSRELDNRGCAFSFVTAMPLDEAVLFFVKELDREGWQQNTKLSFDSEILLLYEKPSKSIIITLTSMSVATKVAIYVGLKIEGHVHRALN